MFLVAKFLLLIMVNGDLEAYPLGVATHPVHAGFFDHGTGSLMASFHIQRAAPLLMLQAPQVSKFLSFLLLPGLLITAGLKPSVGYDA